LQKGNRNIQVLVSKRTGAKLITNRTITIEGKRFSRLFGLAVDDPDIIYAIDMIFFSGIANAT
jgi:hypothetical protein